MVVEGNAAGATKCEPWEAPHLLCFFFFLIELKNNLSVQYKLFLLLFFFFLPAPCGWRDLSSPTRDQTRAQYKLLIDT